VERLPTFQNQHLQAGRVLVEGAHIGGRANTF
jgi:hypothetical protein